MFRTTGAVKVYTPESPLRQPQQLVIDMLRDLYGSRGLAWRLLVRDLTAQYRQTVLGYLWALLPPLVTSLLWMFLSASRMMSIEETELPYPIYALSGTVFWHLFLEALHAPVAQVNSNRALLSRINFPKEALLLSGVGQVLFSFGVKLLALATVAVLLQVPIRWTIIFLVFPVLGLVALGMLLGVFFVPLGVLYKDVQQGLAVVVGPMILLTPAVYPPPDEGLLATAIYLNPVTPLLLTARELMFMGTASALAEFAAVCLAILFLVAIGWLVYRLALPILVERMDA